MKKLAKEFEFWLFRKLLKRYCTKEMDQWDMFQIDTKFGKVFGTFARAPMLGYEKIYAKWEA